MYAYSLSSPNPLEGELFEDFLMELSSMMSEDLVTNVHLVLQDNTSTITLVTKG
jgi:hypothetical protein